jgi:hypothetical protein
MFFERARARIPNAHPTCPLQRGEGSPLGGPPRSNPPSTEITHLMGYYGAWGTKGREQRSNQKLRNHSRIRRGLWGVRQPPGGPFDPLEGPRCGCNNKTLASEARSQLPTAGLRAPLANTSLANACAAKRFGCIEFQRARGLKYSLGI